LIYRFFSGKTPQK